MLNPSRPPEVEVDETDVPWLGAFCHWLAGVNASWLSVLCQLLVWEYASCFWISALGVASHEYWVTVTVTFGCAVFLAHTAFVVVVDGSTLLTSFLGPFSDDFWRFAAETGPAMNAVASKAKEKIWFIVVLNLVFRDGMNLI